MAEPKPESKINPNPQLQSYYASLESVLGYDLLLGGTRHFGYYDDPKTYNPFPIGASLRRMEEVLFRALRARAGASVLDAGCGNGHVARYMVRKGLHVTGVDVVERHIRKARETAGKLAQEKEKEKGKRKGEGEMGSLDVRYMDYHHIDALDDGSFDAVYTIDAFVHATDPERALAGFFRVLKPGGRIAMHEYDNVLEEAEKQSASTSDSSAREGDKKKSKPMPSASLQRSMRQINEYSAMPMNARSRQGALQEMLEAAGFVDVQVNDLSAHIRPMTRFFFLLAIVPFWIVSLLGLERYFINTVAGVGAYRGYDFWRYVQIQARKPGEGASVEGV
ncbi:S-adenosyl-L-methionine-dependent methyltransferase [Nemania abortiva]|nr:S-adenosyl-L-methionine-dependent methyltransferase [Nemania abortiva]